MQDNMSDIKQNLDEIAQIIANSACGINLSFWFLCVWNAE